MEYLLKIEVTEVTSPCVQKALFKLGWSWKQSTGTSISYTEHAFLYVMDNKGLAYGDQRDNFNSKECPEFIVPKGVGE